MIKGSKVPYIKYQEDLRKSAAAPVGVAVDVQVTGPQGGWGVELRHLRSSVGGKLSRYLQLQRPPRQWGKL